MNTHIIPCRRCGSVKKIVSDAPIGTYGEYFTSCKKCITDDDIEMQTENMHEQKKQYAETKKQYASLTRSAS